MIINRINADLANDLGNLAQRSLSMIAKNCEGTGQSRFTTQRREPDQVKILSGVFSDDRTGGRQLTTGTPIALMIENTDQRSKDYSEIRDSYRPGHADYTYDAKYGIRDYRGGGRSSARETAARVAGPGGLQCHASVPGQPALGPRH